MSNNDKMEECHICKQSILESIIYIHNKVCLQKQKEQKVATQEQYLQNQEILNNIVRENNRIKIIKEENLPNSQLQLINQYLDLIEKNQDILKQGKKLLKTANILKGEYQNQEQKNCQQCKQQFQINQNFIKTNCCQKLLHDSCFYQNLRKSTQCFYCQRELIQQKQ